MKSACALMLLLSGIPVQSAVIFSTFSPGAVYTSGGGFGTNFIVTANVFTVPAHSDFLLDSIDVVVRSQGLPVFGRKASGFRLIDSTPQGGPATGPIEFYVIDGALPLTFTQFHFESPTRPRLEAGHRYFLAAYSNEAGIWAEAVPPVTGPAFTGPNQFFTSPLFVPGSGNLSAFEVNGTPVPEPSSSAVCVAGVAFVLALRTRVLVSRIPRRL